MPEGNSFWNPYRWVTVSDQDVQHDVPAYHHRLSGLSGRLRCDLEALTPLLVGDGAGKFVRRCHQPYLPATSLKGAIRSLAEVVGNAAVPFSKMEIDEQHRLAKARDGFRLDAVARMFGYLDGSVVFGGLVRFSDAELSESPCPSNQWPGFEVAVGQPKPKHRAFYPDRNRRKFYHHQAGRKKELTALHPGITQRDRVFPAPSGTRFCFTVNFDNLRDTEIDLLLYCLVLEERATVELGPAALGRGGDEDGAALCGPLRHKLGGAKPHGAGSVRIRVTKLELRTDPTARYRGDDVTESLEGERLDGELTRRTASFRSRTDQTMKELRAMLIYTEDDPRKKVHYPTYKWFQSGSRTPLKPTT